MGRNCGCQISRTRWIYLPGMRWAVARGKCQEIVNQGLGSVNALSKSCSCGDGEKWCNCGFRALLNVHKYSGACSDKRRRLL